MSKLEQRQRREQGIIEMMLSQLEHKRVLELRMSDIAKLAGCSMGVIYSHFPSKEDLLLACANHQMKLDMALLDRMVIDQIDPLDKILAANIFYWVSSHNSISQYALKQFVMNPHVWSAASPYRVDRMNALAGEILEKLKHVATQVNTEFQLELDSGGIEMLLYGLFGSTIGLYQESVCGFIGLMCTHNTDADPYWHLYKQILKRNLKGWDIQPADLDERIDRIYSMTSSEFNGALS